MLGVEEDDTSFLSLVLESHAVRAVVVLRDVSNRIISSVLRTRSSKRVIIELDGSSRRIVVEE